MSQRLSSYVHYICFVSDLPLLTTICKQLKEQLEESEIILTEMESERDELEGQLEATFEENHQHSLDLEALTASLAIANEQVQESEAALSAARDAALVLWADVSIDPLVESLQTERDSLRGEIVELEAR